MITIVGSLKGGSGKSTLTFNLAVWLTLAENKVLVVDADPQATYWIDRTCGGKKTGRRRCKHLIVKP